MATEHSTAHERKVAYHKAYYQLNKDRLRAQMAANYRAKSDDYKARARKWESDNIERKRELRAKYREKYRDKIKEFSRVDWLKHNAKRNARKREYRKERPDLSMHHVRLRQTRKQKATPAWADLTAIKAIYAEAVRLQRETGVKHHVDHEIPLKHPLVCGLHNEFNLRVIPAGENQSKGNSFEV